MKKTIFFLGCCLLGWGSAAVFAQQGIVATGGNAAGTGGSVSYSVGQVSYVTAADANFNLIQGIQQPYEISIMTGMEEPGITLMASVFPNPSSGNITLTVENGKWENLSYRLYDLNGKLLLSHKVEGNETTLNLSHLAASEYFLKVNDNQTEIKIFKIVKIH